MVIGWCWTVSPSPQCDLSLLGEGKYARQKTESQNAYAGKRRQFRVSERGSGLRPVASRSFQCHTMSVLLCKFIVAKAWRKPSIQGALWNLEASETLVLK